MGKRLGASLLLAVVVCLFALPRADAVPMKRDKTALYTGNWSGYVVTAKPGARLDAVGGSWIIPEATTGPSGFSSQWVGIGGLNSNTLIQAGTETGRALGHYAWYELIPGPSVQLTGCQGDAACTVWPGDRMSTTITKVGTNTWSLTMLHARRTDSPAAPAWSWSKTVSYRSDEDSAEWILETPGTVTVLGKSPENIPENVKSMHFLPGGSYRDSGAWRSLGGSGARRVVETLAGLMALATPSTLAADGHFAVCTFKSTCRNY